MWGPLTTKAMSNKGDSTAPSEISGSQYSRRLSTVESYKKNRKNRKSIDFRNPMMMLSQNMKT